MIMSEHTKYEPLVTIVIPVYNGHKYVATAIESALNQTYTKVEVLVINDGSTDNTEEAIEPYRDRIRYIKKENGGVSSVLNLALKEMKGIWLSWLSHDDVYLTTKVESQINKLNTLLDSKQVENAESCVLCCQDERIDENGNKLPQRKRAHHSEQNQYTLIAEEIKHYTIGGCTVLGARSAYLAVGGFNEENRTISDAEMWFKLMKSGYSFVFSEDIEVQSRYHKDMVSVKREELVQVERDQFYSTEIRDIGKHITDAELSEIAITMTKYGLKKSVSAALEFYRGNIGLLKFKLIGMSVYRYFRGRVRNLYRFLRWRKSQ